MYSTGEDILPYLKIGMVNLLVDYPKVVPIRA